MSLKVIYKRKEAKFSSLVVEKIQILGKAPYVEEIKTLERKKIKMRWENLKRRKQKFDKDNLRILAEKSKSIFAYVIKELIEKEENKPKSWKLAICGFFWHFHVKNQPIFKNKLILATFLSIQYPILHGEVSDKREPKSETD